MPLAVAISKNVICLQGYPLCGFARVKAAWVKKINGVKNNIQDLYNLRDTHTHTQHCKAYVT